MEGYTYSIQLDITNASWEFRNELNRILDGMKYKAPGIIDYHLIEQNNEEE